MANFGFVLPVVHVYGLGKVAEVPNQGRFPEPRNLILDPIGQALIEMVLEGSLHIPIPARHAD